MLKNTLKQVSYWGSQYLYHIKLPKYNNLAILNTYPCVCQKPRFIHWFLMQIRKNTSKYLSLQCFWSDSQIRGLAQKRVNLVLLCEMGWQTSWNPKPGPIPVFEDFVQKPICTDEFELRFSELKLWVDSSWGLQFSSWNRAGFF